MFADPVAVSRKLHKHYYQFGDLNLWQVTFPHGNNTEKTK